MSERAITLSEVADYLTCVAWGSIKPIELKEGTWFLSEREFNLIRWARRALKIMAEANQESSRFSEIKDCEELFEAIIVANSKDDKPVPHPEMTLDGADLTLMRKAVVFVTEFDIRKKRDDAEETRAEKWTKKGKR